MAKIINQEILFNSSPNKLFNFYMDDKIHTEITGKKAKIGSKAGENFNVFRGEIKGKILHVLRNKLIVHTWRAQNWDKSEMDSIVTLTFNQNEDGSTKVSLFQSNVPEDCLDEVKKGWNTYYWQAWKKFINNSDSNPVKTTKRGRKTKSSDVTKTGKKKLSKKGRPKKNITIT